MANQQTAPEAQAKASEGEAKVNFKKDYEEAITSVGLYHPAATNTGERVLNRLLKGTVISSLAEINKQIAEAAAKNEEELMEKLFAERKKLKDAQSENLKSLSTIRKATPFDQILIAYKPEIEALAYELALDVLKSTHLAINATKGGKPAKTGSKPEDKTTREAAQYTVKKGGESITFTKRLGRGGANLKQDEAEFGFLGFKVVLNEENKEALEPSTIELNDGNHVPATRNNIIKAIEEKNAKSLEGYTAELIK